MRIRITALLLFLFFSSYPALAEPLRIAIEQHWGEPIHSALSEALSPCLGLEFELVSPEDQYDRLYIIGNYRDAKARLREVSASSKSTNDMLERLNQHRGEPTGLVVASFRGNKSSGGSWGLSTISSIERAVEHLAENICLSTPEAKSAFYVNLPAAVKASRNLTAERSRCNSDPESRSTAYCKEFLRDSYDVVQLVNRTVTPSSGVGGNNPWGNTPHAMPIEISVDLSASEDGMIEKIHLKATKKSDGKDLGQIDVPLKQISSRRMRFDFPTRLWIREWARSFEPKYK